MGKRTRLINRNNWLVVLSIILVVAVGSVLVAYNQFSQFSLEGEYVYKANYRVINPQTVSDINAPLYKIVVNEKLKLPIPAKVSFHFGPNSDGYNLGKDNSKEVIVKSNHKLPVGKVYKNSDYSLTISSYNPELLGFINSHEYCNVDSDCSQSYVYCNNTINNGYQIYAIYGCGGPPEYLGLTDKEKSMCPSKKWIDDERYSTATIKYDALKCINNKCQGIGRKVVCQK